MSWQRERVRRAEPHVRPGLPVQAIADAAGLTLYDTALALRDITRREYCKALRTGVLARPAACADCGSGGRIHGHHPDYTQPLNVEWLCARCHKSRHPFHEPSAFRRKDLARKYAARPQAVRPQPESLVRVQEAATVLGMSCAAVYAMARRGEIAASRVGRLWRFRPSDIQALRERFVA